MASSFAHPDELSIWSIVILHMDLVDDSMHQDVLSSQASKILQLYNLTMMGRVVKENSPIEEPGRYNLPVSKCSHLK